LGLHSLLADANFTVSGGQFGAPYFNFADGAGQTPDFTSVPLYRGETYQFSDSGVSGSHPFMIGESYGDTTSSLVSGGPLNGSGGTITVTIPSDFNGSLYYFCTNHSDMIFEFTISVPAPSVSFLSKVTAPDGATSDAFGFSVSHSGNILAVGASSGDSGDIADTGAAYLYRFESNGSTTFISKVTAPDGAANDDFGRSISLSGNILAVGASSGDSGDIPKTGAAYLYRFESNGSTTFISKVTAPDAAYYDTFGGSVSLSGNILAVGAIRSDWGELLNPGAAYLYELESNGSVKFLNKVTAPDGDTNDNFGYSVFQLGNMLAVGADGADIGGLTNAGCAYLYELESNGSVTYLTTILAPDGAGWDKFGSSVSLASNILSVGAENGDSSEVADTGAAYLYEVESNGSVTFLTKVTAPDGADNDMFGYNLSQSGNLLAVGAYGAKPDSLYYGGATYL